jgi:hypothetical protein
VVGALLAWRFLPARAAEVHALDVPETSETDELAEAS